MSEDINKKEVYLILHNIRSVHNVGAIFRTADAVGVSRIVLNGYTPGPLDRFGRERGDFKKASLGAEKTVPFEHTDDIFKFLSDLKKKGFYIVAIEQNKKSIDYKKVKIKNKTAIIVGNEVGGISKEILKKCDTIAEISMLGKKESLNVSVALGVALFRILNI